MQRQRGSLVPVAEVVSGLNGPVKAIREASPQALHHFTRFDQVGVTPPLVKNCTLRSAAG